MEISPSYSQRFSDPFRAVRIPPVPLPIDEIADALRASICPEIARARVLLKAPTGSGKSTVVPGIVADGVGQGMVVVIEPRRMAARLLAGWVARLRGVRLGEEVGYAVRFDTRYRRDSRIVFVTDGVFQRWLQDDPDLPGVSAVVFDEFHERRLAMDVALGRCLDLQEAARPDLRVIVMSATLETAGLAEFLTPVAALEAGGRSHPVDVLHRAPAAASLQRSGGPPRETPVWDRMVEICRETVAMPDAGDILMFLPGNHEIRRTISLLENQNFARGFEIHSLHGSLPPEAQERAIQPGTRPKIIVATNVAETSITIEGVRTVIDSGLARIAAFDVRRGINTLHIRKISRAAAEQRAGRAGRTAPGRAFRLWSQTDHAKRDAFEIPEVHRIDLADAVLSLKSAGVADVACFRWLTPPAADALARAEIQLHDLGATDAHGALTPAGHRMAKLPLEPRAARLMLAGAEYDCASEAAFIAAAIEGEELFVGGKSGSKREDFQQAGDLSDFAADWRAFDSACAVGFEPGRCQNIGVSARAARETAKAFDRLASLAKKAGFAWHPPDFTARGEAVAHAMLAAFSDHLAIRLNLGTLACRMTANRKGRLDDTSCVKSAAAFVAAEITEVQAREVVTHLRRATAIDPAWLEAVFPDDLQRRDGAAWDETRRRVVRRRETRFRDLVIESSESDQNVPPDAAAELLAARVLSGELNLKNWNHEVEQWTARLVLLGEWMPELEMPGWDAEDQAAAIAQICHGTLSYKEIKEAAVWPVLREWLNAAQRHALDHYCPERLTLPGGRTARITYEAGKPPWFSARVADLFGMWKTPTVADGRVPLLVHILTPGQKPWQMTRDLESFWANGYFQMKKEIAGRYPRHPWPEDPKAG
jgi:ATP-dependent helicase HrpB